MSQDDLILLFFKISTISIIVSALAFIITYTRLAPWWKSVIGRTLVWKDLLLILALVPTALSFFIHLSPAWQRVAAWSDIGDFFLITAVLLNRCKIWVRIHRNGRTP